MTSLVEHTINGCTYRLPADVDVEAFARKVERATRDARNPDSGKHPHARKHGWAIGNTRKPSKLLLRAMETDPLDGDSVRVLTSNAKAPAAASGLRGKARPATVRAAIDPDCPRKDVTTMSDTPDDTPAEASSPKLDDLSTDDLLRLRGKVERELDVRRMALQAQLDALTAATSVPSEATQPASKLSRSVTKGRVAARPKKRAKRSRQNKWTDERTAAFVKVYTEEGSKAASERFGIARQTAAQKMHKLRKDGIAPPVGA